MKSSYGGGRVCVMTTTLLFLLFGCLAPCIQGRSTLLNNGGETKSFPRNSHLTFPCPSSRSRPANSTSPADDDESKIKLVMCVDKGLRGVVGEPCFCCALERPAPRCYFTHSECEAKCPFCYPPPCSPGPAVEGR
ncbi:hypothetical protein PVAP13_1KG071800 [Panicum virgatum]|uniref:Bowman-Birk serine protease inhibitors family domain-containing protein n=1 Tax=Panicum virgatum TaxID=38727 RepID=A0A8T0XB32_PANVG|nr:hypothetical protein PVAP13_1KG071800 [Panicum virgatum]